MPTGRQCRDGTRVIPDYGIETCLPQRVGDPSRPLDLLPVRHYARMLQHCPNKQTLCHCDCRPPEGRAVRPRARRRRRPGMPRSISSWATRIGPWQGWARAPRLARAVIKDVSDPTARSKSSVATLATHPAVFPWRSDKPARRPLPCGQAGRHRLVEGRAFDPLGHAANRAF